MTNRPKPVCKDCKKRNPGCHSKCADYISYRKDVEEYNRKIKEERKLSAEWSNYKRKRVCGR